MKSRSERKMEILFELDEYIEMVLNEQEGNPGKYYFLINAMKFRWAETILAVEDCLKELETSEN